MNAKQINSAIIYIKQAIKALSQDVSKDITQQQAEDLQDNVIDRLKAALCRLGADRSTQ